MAAKAYYGALHGYSFSLHFSADYVAYLPDDIFKNVLSGSDKPNGNRYQVHVMSKPLVVLSAMYEHPEAEWVVFSDDDVWWNRHLHYTLPLFIKPISHSILFILRLLVTTY